MTWNATITRDGNRWGYALTLDVPSIYEQLEKLGL